VVDGVETGNIKTRRDTSVTVVRTSSAVRVEEELASEEDVEKFKMW